MIAQRTPARDPVKAGAGRRLATLGVASALAAISGWNAGNIGPVADPLSASYGVGLSTVGLLITALLIVHSLGQIPAGSWTDRLGARRAGLVSIGVLVAGNLVAAAVPDFALAVAARAVMGIGTALALLAGSGFLRLAGESTVAQGWLGGMGIGGGGLAIAVVPRLEPWLSWRAPYVSGLAVCVLALAFMALAPATRPARQAGGVGLRFVLSIGNAFLGRLALIHAGSMGVGLIASAWVVPLLTRHGFGVGPASAAGSLILLGGVVSRPLGGWLQARRPAWTAGLIVASAVMAVVAMVLVVAPWGLAVATLGCALIGLTSGFPFGVVFTQAALARPDAPSMAVGFVNMCANLTVVVGTALLGLAFLVPGGVTVGFLALAGLGSASGLAARGLRSAIARGRVPLERSVS